MRRHHYKAELNWTGNTGKGTQEYNSYQRNFTLHGEQKEHIILGSSDPEFLGNPSRFNPEEMLLHSVASCHLLWYLHLCATNGVTVNSYIDKPEGVMEEDETGKGAFKRITLHPTIVINKAKNVDLAITLHREANAKCFIANSCNFEINHLPIITSNE